jgi:hypothetical protein
MLPIPIKGLEGSGGMPLASRKIIPGRYFTITRELRTSWNGTKDCNMKIRLKLTYHEIGALIEYTGLLHNTLLEERENITGATIRKAELRSEILQLQGLATRLFPKQFSHVKRHKKQPVSLSIGEAYLLFKYRQLLNDLSDEAAYTWAVMNLHIEPFSKILLS